MRTTYTNQPSKMLIALIGLASLSACGGGSDMDPPQSAQNAPAVSAAATQVPVPAANAAPVPAADSAEPATTAATVIQGSRAGILLTPTTLVPTAPSAPPGTVVTDVKFDSTGSGTQTGAPVTFGQVFVQGAVPLTSTLSGRLSNGTMVPLQLDVKARHADGSARHAVISAVLPSLTAGQPQVMSLVTAAPYAAATGATPAALLSSGFTAAAHITLAGKAYSVSADTLLKDGKFTNWLAGPVVNEWHVSAPLKAGDGSVHPHLTARFALRSYSGSKKTRVDVTIENNWAYETAPQNFVYDAQIVVGGQPVYAKAGMTHYHHARWRKLFWWGGEPQVHVKHNAAYMMQTRAVPNYDQSLVFTETLLAKLKTAYTGTRTEPMGVGAAMLQMGAAGARPDIGILPGWAVTYMLSGDKRAKDVTMGTADLAGSWSVHYRNRDTDRPVSLIDFPYMTILGNRADTKNPATGKLEAFPVCATTTACKSPNLHDTSHQPSFAYLPYIVTGDYYYLEEMQFWAMYNTFVSNPGYRETVKGLFKRDQVRGQAWSMRSISQAAYITPDADPLKAQFEYFVKTNLEWYNANYANNTNSNRLGVLDGTGAVIYNSKLGVAPWQDDFFTAAIGVTHELGFADAKTLLDYKAKFPVGRINAAGFCWIEGAMYSMKVRATETSPLYTSMAEVYKANHDASFVALPCAGTSMASVLKLRVGEMTGYSTVVTGYPANLQPALAYSASSSVQGAAAAWQLFAARPYKPNYAAGPQFAILPR